MKKKSNDLVNEINNNIMSHIKLIIQQKRNFP